MSTLRIARDSVRWRPDYIVSHIDMPVYDSRTTRTTYSKILARLPRVLQGTWVLTEVHIKVIVAVCYFYNYFLLLPYC